MNTPELTEAQEAERGALIAEVLQLRRNPREQDRWSTTWGTKTDLGLFRTVKRLIEEGK
jgi:hypothetical protein